MVTIPTANRPLNKGGDTVRMYGMLRERIHKVFDTQQAFAVAMDKSCATINKKLSGKCDWTSQEIEKACVLLGISMDEMPIYFFY